MNEMKASTIFWFIEISFFPIPRATLFQSHSFKTVNRYFISIE